MPSVSTSAGISVTDWTAGVLTVTNQKCKSFKHDEVRGGGGEDRIDERTMRLLLLVMRDGFQKPPNADTILRENENACAGDWLRDSATRICTSINGIYSILPY